MNSQYISKGSNGGSYGGNSKPAGAATDTLHDSSGSINYGQFGELGRSSHHRRGMNRQGLPSYPTTSRVERVELRVEKSIPKETPRRTYPDTTQLMPSSNHGANVVPQPDYPSTRMQSPPVKSSFIPPVNYARHNEEDQQLDRSSFHQSSPPQEQSHSWKRSSHQRVPNADPVSPALHPSPNDDATPTYLAPPVSAFTNSHKPRAPKPAHHDEQHLGRSSLHTRGYTSDSHKDLLLPKPTEPIQPEVVTSQKREYSPPRKFVPPPSFTHRQSDDRYIGGSSHHRRRASEPEKSDRPLHYGTGQQRRSTAPSISAVLPGGQLSAPSNPPPMMTNGHHHEPTRFERHEQHLGGRNGSSRRRFLQQNYQGISSRIEDEDDDSGLTGRCPPLNLEWLLQLKDKRRNDAAQERGARVNWKRSVIEENELVECLMKQGFTSGLGRTLVQNTDRFSVRIWLVNNSGSMNQNDGHLVVQDPKDPYKFSNINCTRWEEVQKCVLWHAEWSAMLKASMAVRFLNDPGVTVGPQQLGVAASANRDIDQEVSRLKHVFTKSRPSGTTELTAHLQEIVSSITVMADRLRERNEMVALVIVTDSLPAQGEGEAGRKATKEFLNTLRSLQGLPVWIVVRLSTDEQRVVDFYNDLDEKVDAGPFQDENHSGRIAVMGQPMHLDVLDDFVSEAQEVYQHNPWLNYALPLHLCRESGVSSPAFDALDNRPLSPNELVDFVQLLFDRRINVDPKVDYPFFRNELEDLVTKERKLFHPIKKKFMPWIDMKEIDKTYGSPGSSASCNCVIQ